MASVHHRFLRYRISPGSQPLLGLVSEDETKVTAILNPATALPYSELFDLIEDHPDVLADYRFQLISGSERPLSEVEKLAPLPGRDILCIGKNYIDHAKEFNQSGFDASDKKDQPEFPVFFTKRASSIVPDGHPIYLHPTVSSSVDYEGELGIIIGKGGIQIKKQEAWKHVWGAVIINDVTARERQRDHKQFFIGKSLDTFCPMGAYVIPSSSLSWKDLHLTTRVNGEVRQSQNTSELIFDVPTLIETASMGITLQPGDVIATGTPYGTGMATKTWLKEGDVVEISVPPLGVLRNPIASPSAPPFPVEPVRAIRPVAGSTVNDSRLLTIGSPPKRLHVELIGPADGPAIIFFHGLGGTLQSFKPVVEVADLAKKNRVILFDLDGQGQSPLSVQGHRGLSIQGFAEDGKGILDALNIKRAHVVGHSMGGLVATLFATLYPDVVKNLVLIGPALLYWAEKKQGIQERADLIRKSGISVLAEQFAAHGLSKITLASKPLVKTFVEQSVTSILPDAYMLAAIALADAPNPDFSRIKADKVVILAGRDDAIIPKRLIDLAEAAIKGAEVVWLEDVGHWHMLEDVQGTANILGTYLM